ncbi:siderophore-interacting protein [Uliginosibacterium sp. H3]|uniref:Siderophore-interacting protein n=1 Tax=Uliginosibacterium silvisoli TaxID=3114758 RepID=A0ABU6K0W7_9RHOO|nr:siderophore-interacting protein [Uliginosibacterium sp. H3]
MTSATRPDSTRRPERIRHTPKFRQLEVLRVERITPHIVSVDFRGEDLHDFVSASFDDHVKFMLPATPDGELTLPVLGPEGPKFPEGARPVMRDYTPRRFDTQGREITIEFALHGDGPIAQWATQAKPGQKVGIGGPRGSTVIPVDYDWHLLIGDETALPAISRRLEELPTSVQAIVIVETGDAADQRALASAANVKVQWLVQQEASGLVAAVRALQLPAGEGFAWAAGESATITAVREVLIEEQGLDKHQVKASAYWKQGEKGHHGKIE